LIIIFIELDSQ